MKPIRILIVDDSSTVRMMLTRLLGEFRDIEVLRAATNGRHALQLIESPKPDLVLLDVEMPELDGIETLKRLRQSHPSLPVIMFSRHTTRGAVATIDALLLNADDYVPKPESGEELRRCLNEELVPRIRALVCRSPETSARLPVDPGKVGLSGSVRPSGIRGPTTVAKTGSLPQSARDNPPEIIVVGCSTGGPAVLMRLLQNLKEHLTVPLLIAQHMPPSFTTALAQRLADKTGLIVREAVDAQPIGAAQVWVAPGDYHLVVDPGSAMTKIRIEQTPAENGCRPSADVLFRSAARTFRHRVLGVVLTGMGQDALEGSREIVSVGGSVIVQDNDSSAAWGMPGQVARASLAAAVMDPDNLAREIVARLRGRR